MGRVTKTPLIILGLSPNASATALDIRPDEVQDAIKSGALPVFCIGIRRRILTSDLEKWVRSWPKPVAKKRTPKHAIG